MSNILTKDAPLLQLLAKSSDFINCRNNFQIQRRFGASVALFVVASAGMIGAVIVMVMLMQRQTVSRPETEACRWTSTDQFHEAGERWCRMPG